MPTITGLTPGQYYPAGSLYSQGLSFGTPRDWSRGGMQFYDPSRVRPLVSESSSRLRTPATYTNPGAKPSSGGITGGAGVPRLSSFGAGNVGGLGNFQGGQISTSIQPQGIYEPWMTQYATNQLRADALAGADPFYAQKAFDRPGVSRSAGTLSAAMPGIARSHAAARQIGAGVPLSDAIANYGNVLGGEIEREQEALGYGSLYARMLSGQLGFNRAQQGQGLTNFGTIGSLLAGIYGG